MNQSDDRYSPGAGLENPVLIDNLSDGEWSDDDKIICKKSRAILDGSNNLCKSDLILQRSQIKTSEPIADADTNDCRVARIDDADKASMDTQTGTVMKCELSIKPIADAMNDAETNDCRVGRIDDADKASIKATYWSFHYFLREKPYKIQARSMLSYELILSNIFIEMSFIVFCG